MKKIYISLLLIGALLLCSCSAYTSVTTEAPDFLPPSASKEPSPSPSVTPSASSQIEEPVTPNYGKFKDFPLTEQGAIDFEYLNSPRKEEGLVSFTIKFICTSAADRELFSSVGGWGAKTPSPVNGGKEVTIIFENHNINGRSLNQEELEKLSADDRIVQIVYMGDLIPEVQ